MVEENAHRRGVTGSRGTHHRRRTRAEQPIAGRMRALHRRRAQLGIRIGLVRERDLHQLESGHRARRLAVGPPIDLGGHVHIHSGVEHRHAGGIGDIGVCAALEKHRRDVVVPVNGRDDRRRREIGIKRVLVGARIDEDTRGVERALARGVHQRRPAAMRKNRQHAFEAEAIFRIHQVVRAQVDVRAVRNQQLRCVGMILGRRPHQRRLAQELLAGVDDGAGFEQQLDGLGTARPRGGHEDRLAGLDLRLRIGAGLEQDFDEIAAGIVRGQRQRRHAVPVRGIRVRARAGKQPGDRHLVCPRRPVQRCRAIRLRRVDGGPACRRREHRAHRVGVAGLHRIDQRQPGAAGAERDEDRERERPEGALHANSSIGASPSPNCFM